MNDLGMISTRVGDRLFERIYIEKTGWRFKDPTDPHASHPERLHSGTRHVYVETTAWFDRGVVLIEVRARAGDDPLFQGDQEDPTGLTIASNMTLSSAVRVAIRAHDRAVERAKPGLPENAERVS